MYGDAIFATHETIISRNRNPTDLERLVDMRMSAQQIHIEHCFADHNNLFGIFFVILGDFSCSTAVSMSAN
jgi:hypothetical protein